jgi:hypothetical protein
MVDETWLELRTEYQVVSGAKRQPIGLSTFRADDNPPFVVRRITNTRQLWWGVKQSAASLDG